MASQFIKSTFGSESVTKVAMFADSVLGCWSFDDRFNSSAYDLIKYYKDRGFDIEFKDFSINGGGYYNSRPGSYVIEPWMNADGGSPTRFADRAAESAVSWGATHVLLLFGSREATQGNTNPNPAGGNYFGEETIVLIQSYIDYFSANNIEVVVSTTNASTDQTTQDKFTALTNVILEKGVDAGWNMINTYDVMTDPQTGLGRPDDFIDFLHWDQDNGTGIGHGRYLNSLIPYFNNLYSLTQPVWDLQEDIYCPPKFDGLDFSNPFNSQYLPLISGGGI